LIINLTGLKFINLSGNPIIAMPDLTDFLQLETFNISESLISDFRVIAKNLPKSIVSLTVDKNDISDITGLEKFINLKSFIARSNKISDLTPMANLLELRSFPSQKSRQSHIS
jgi:internalin A